MGQASRRRPSRGRADLEFLRTMTEEEIERTSPPELANLPEDFWEGAELVPPVIKAPISIRIDEDILDWFRSRGPRYQSRMNAVLRSYVTAMRKSSPKRKPAARRAKWEK
jgi:uncharacterized protein (DUF4415 family)